MAFAQEAFEVASVKPSAATSDDFAFPQLTIEPGGRVVATNMPLRELLLRAYGLQPFQLEGGPGWIDSARFDITARAESGSRSNRGQLMRMLQDLVVQRFSLRSRTVTRELPIYALTVVRRDGRLGPKLRPSTRDCGAALAEREPLDSSPIDGDAAPCRPRSMMMVGAAGATMSWSRVGMRMADLAALLTPHARRIVVDRTGLAGTFDFEFEFSPEGVKAFLPGGAPPITAAPPADGMSVQSALQEQLGLRLDSVRGPVEILVIESAGKPSENE